MNKKIIVNTPKYNAYWLESDGINVFLFQYESHTKEKNEDSFTLRRKKINP